MKYYYHEGKNLLLNKSELRHYFGVDLSKLSETQLTDSGFVVAEDPNALNSEYVSASVFAGVCDGFVYRQLKEDPTTKDQLVFLNIQNESKSK